MKKEIIIPYGGLEREVWNFSLHVGGTSAAIYLESYSFQTRISKQHKWIKQTNWGRLDKRDNNIDNPPRASGIEAEAKDYFQSQVGELPIVY